MAFRPSPASSLNPWGNGLWQWYNWRWPVFRHQFTTNTIWRPGFVPYRNTAWQADISGWTIGRYGFDLGFWSGQRSVAPSGKFAIDMNTGSVVTLP